MSSTPISLNLGAANDFFTSKELLIMTNLAHKFTDNISFNTSYMKQTWTEGLQEHRTTNAFAVDINNQAVTNLTAMRSVPKTTSGYFREPPVISCLLLLDKIQRKS